MRYHLKVTFATTRRLLQELRHDPRTLGLLFVVPCALLGLLRWLYSENVPLFNHIGPALLGIFPFIIMFLITSVTTLRERSSGTLERLMATAAARGDIIVGYMCAFGLLAIIQSLLACGLLLLVFAMPVSGPVWFIILVAVIDALLGTALGLLVSAFARTEFQAVQFMPALIFPQLLVGGLFVPLAAMPHTLEVVAYCLPLTYAIDALSRTAHVAALSFESWRDTVVIVACIILATVLATVSLRRQER